VSPDRRRRRRTGRGSTPGYEPVGQVEFPGIMGWMQRNMRWLFLGGIVVLVVSLGAGTLFGAGFGQPTSGVEATATPTVEATPTPEATETPETIQRNYDAAPEMTIDTSKQYEALIRLESGGEVRLELFARQAPVHVNNFVFLAQHQFFDGLTFHRVLPNFVAQGGDPLGTGFGGPGYMLPEERNTQPFAKGVIAMAKSSAGVSGSQFFITLRPTPELADGFTVFGRVLEGMEHVESITPRDPSQPNQPPGDVIESVEIIEKD
jgi:peptidylprolyl isomerase